MFDTFNDKHSTIFCPHCSSKQALEDGVQSKHFENLLFEFYVGDVVNITQETTGVSDWMWCEFCNDQIPVFFGFKNQIYLGIFQTEKEAKSASRKFDIYANYKKLYQEKESFERRTNTLESRIKDTIEIHGKKPNKSKFGFLYSIHGNFIDYDIIKTLKNILDDDRNVN